MDYNIIYNPSDPKSGWDTGATTNFIPSPYSIDGSFNNQIIMPTSSWKNGCSILDGKEITQETIRIYTPMEEEEELHPSLSHFFKAVSYYTLGSKPGDWYCPTILDLLYISARLDTINTSLEKIWKIFKRGAYSFDMNYITCISDNRYMYGNPYIVTPYYIMEANTTRYGMDGYYLIPFTRM